MSEPNDASLQEIAGVRLTKVLARERLRTVWAGDTAGGDRFSVHALASDLAGTADAEQFASSARRLREAFPDGSVPGIARVHAVTEDGQHFVGDFFKRGSVAGAAALGWGLERKLELFRALCAALGELHAREIVHGCLRPENVLLDDGLKPKVSDAGLVDIALTLEGDPENAHGYGAFAAPEARYGMAMDARTDVYGAGRLLYFLLVDRTPPEVTEPVPVLEALGKSAPPGLVRIVRKCLLSEPEGRYVSMAELLDDVLRFRSHAATVGCAPPPAPEVEAAPPNAEPVAADAGTPEGGAAAAPGELPPISPLVPPPRAAPGAARAPSSPRARAVKPARPPRPGAPTTPGALAATTPLITPKVRAMLAAAGLVVLVVSVVVARLAGAESLALRGAVALGAVVAALAAPTLPGRPALGRVLAAASALVLSTVIDPIALAAGSGLRARLTTGDVPTRAKLIRELAPKGEKHHEDAALAGADFTEAVLTNVCFDRATLSGASFRRATLSGAHLQQAKLDGAIFAGAELGGADLTGADVTGVTDLDKAICNPRTRLPAGWLCERYRPTRADSVNVAK